MITEFLMNFGWCISFAAVLLSDAVIFFRGRKNKTKEQENQELIDNVKRLVSVIKGNDEEVKK